MSEAGENGDLQAQLGAAALAAMAQAYAPYSHFPVGAALLDEHGRIFAGANVENAALQGWCAEVSALGALVSAGGRRVKAVAVAAQSALLCTPCGVCRQRLREFAAADTPVHIFGPEGFRRSLTMAELLPYSFGPDVLESR